jgi:hypothetical protein
LAVINQGGPQATLPFLADLTARWIAEGADRASPLWREAHDLSGPMLLTWPGYAHPGGEAPSETTRLLSDLGRLDDKERIDDFLAGVSAVGRHRFGDGQAVVEALRLLSGARATALLEAIISAAPPSALDGAADLLARAVEGSGLRLAELAAAARTLVAAMPGDPASAPEPQPREMRPRAMKVSVVVDTLRALDGIDPNLADQALDVMLAWPKTYDPDGICLPTALALAGAGPAARRLGATVLAHLRADRPAPGAASRPGAAERGHLRVRALSPTRRLSRRPCRADLALQGCSA